MSVMFRMHCVERLSNIMHLAATMLTTFFSFGAISHRVTTCQSYVSWQNFIWEWHFPAFQLTELSVFSTTALIANGKHASL